MKIITVEPRGAACVFQSHVEGKLFALEGDLKTIMAGLNCGTPSGLGWPILKNSAFAFMSCIDEITIDGMNLYYYSQEGKKYVETVSKKRVTKTVGCLLYKKSPTLETFVYNVI